MHFIRLDGETDFAGWRKAARALVQNGIPPAEVTWTAHGRDAELFAPDGQAAEVETSAAATFTVPARFIALAQSAVLHRDGERFALLYRLLWRLQSHHELLAIATDQDMARLHAMAKAVH